jgi:hypothetical protein
MMRHLRDFLPVWVIALSFLVMGPAIVGPAGNNGDIQRNSNGSFGAIACGSANTLLHAGSPPACSAVVTADLPASGVGAATYGGGTQQTPNITLDATGRATAASNVTQSGMKVLVNTMTASSQAALSDTTSITGSYVEYEVVLEKLVPATNNVFAQLQVHVAGGGFQNSGYITETLCDVASATAFGAATTGIPLNVNASISNTGIVGVTGIIHLYLPAQNSMAFDGHTIAQTTNATSQQICTVGGWYPNNGSAIDGIQFVFSSGNIASGTMKIYGFN